jgi:F-type H+-transporting ATPase subunit b
MEGIGELGINIQSLIAQIVNFVILLLVLGLVAYKPVLKMLDERSRRIKESLEQAEIVKQQAEAAQDETKQRIAEATREGQEVVSRALKAGEDLRVKAKADAQVEAETLLTRARVEISRERDDAIDSVRREFADLTVVAAEKVIDRSLDKTAHREVIEEVLAKSDTLKKG